MIAAKQLSLRKQELLLLSLLLATQAGHFHLPARQRATPAFLTFPHSHLNAPNLPLSYLFAPGNSAFLISPLDSDPAAMLPTCQIQLKVLLHWFCPCVFLVAK